MQSFQVLDRREKINQSLLLEASAGTGKTFSIEHTVVRLLIEGESLSLDQILVVTFTRAATRDLRARIHQNIVFAIDCLKEKQSENIPDYLAAILEEGPERVHRALRCLQRAIGVFDFAQIYTIHGFCGQMLGDYLFESRFQGSSLDSDQILLLRPIIRDYFRTISSSKAISLAELNLLLNHFSGDLAFLEQQLINAIAQGVPFDSEESFEERISRFREVMYLLKTQYGWTSSHILADFALLAPCYKEICDRKKQIKAEISSRVEDFASLFDKESWDAADLHWVQADQLFLLDLFDQKQRKASALSEDCLPLKIPGFREQLRNFLLPVVSMQGLFCCLAADCMRFIALYKQKEGIGNYDDLLTAMENALDHSDFSHAIQRRYRAAIIDEFQDTDPVQWRIFKRLFLEKKDTHVYLVGDPKQSIYAFRQADLYTYFEAAERMGNSQQRSLDTNFRSQKDLIDALNFLFCEETAPGLFSLPKKKIFLKYPCVKSPLRHLERTFEDKRGSVHFFGVEVAFSRGFSLEKCESEGLFSFLVQEILSLVQEEGFLFRQIAILVADRFQSMRVTSFLSQWNIPCATQKTEILTDSLAFASVREVLMAVIYPKDFSAVKIALAGKIIGWTCSDLLSLDESENLQRVSKIVYLLRKELFDRGIALFFEMLLDTVWKGSETTLEVLLKREGGEVFFQDLRQIIQLLAEQECQEKCGPERLLLFLDQLQSYPDAYEARLRRLEDATRNAVQVLTTHSSKGLEFDIVFNLGLIKRTKSSALFIPEEQAGKCSMRPLIDRNAEAHARFCCELDAEKLRQLYVAFTRAKERLYNAVVFVKEGNEPEIGTASPMELFMAHLGRNTAADFKEIYSHICGYRMDLFRNFIARAEGLSLSYSDVSRLEVSAHPYLSEIADSIGEIPPVKIPIEPRFVHSFTSLSRSSEREIIEGQSEFPHDFFSIEKTPHTLPVGAMTGSLLHECFESIPFEEGFKWEHPSQLSRFLKAKIDASRFADWETVIYEMLFRAIKVPFIEGSVLCELAPGSYSREMEFLYTSEMPQIPGQIKGFMDLFFFHKGKYYLLDWKSNWLGPDERFYNQDALRKAMEQHDYFLQADLYEQALKKYLKLFDSRPFSEIFGGTYYIFLRGLQADCHGIYNYQREQGFDFRNL